MTVVSADLHSLLHLLWTKAVHQDGYDKHEWQHLESLLHNRDALPAHEPPFAQLYNTWEELEALATLVDAEINGEGRLYPEAGWLLLLNSLGTQLREAQQTLRR